MRLNVRLIDSTENQFDVHELGPNIKKRFPVRCATAFRVGHVTDEI